MAIQMTNFKWDQDADGFVTITWDMPGRSMNVISDAALEEMRLWVDAITKDDTVKGVILTSGKPHFSGGADLNEMEASLKVPPGADPLVAVKPAIDRTQKFHQVLRALETCKKPVIAAITGTALGGALEMCLACHARIAADNPRALIGLPEARIGILPGGGGTQRLPRIIGARNALPLMLQGQRLDPKAAQAAGIIAKVVPPTELLAEAKKWLKESPISVQPWDDKGFRIPDGGGPYTPKGFETFTAGNAMLHRETYGNYPAQINIMKCVYEGLQVPIDAGLRIELRYFVDLLRRPESRSMIRTVFLSTQALEKGARRPQAVPASQVKKLGVLGAGTMGAGIANVSAAAGMDVTLIDRDQASADKGKAHAAETLDRDISRGRATEQRKQEVLSHINPTPDYGALKDCDFIIEAVFEDRNVKAEATKKAEAVLPETTIFGSNTSTLPITSLAENSPRPEKFIGIHFFSPVERMGLVEIIRGKKTSDEALARAMDYVRQIKKTPIVVNDGRGFYTSRSFSTYSNEGALMIAEGIYPALIENVGRMSGMPMGPLEVINSVGLGTPLHIIRQTNTDLGLHKDEEAEMLYAFVGETNARTGRNAGKGFYDYENGRRTRLWPEIYDYDHKSWNKDADPKELRKRFLYVQAREAALCMEEGVVTDPRDADVGAVLGWGFAPFTGGPLSLIDSMGVANFVGELKALQKKHGDRFKPTKLLNAMAKSGEIFYQRFTPQKAA